MQSHRKPVERTNGAMGSELPTGAERQSRPAYAAPEDAIRGWVRAMRDTGHGSYTQLERMTGLGRGTLNDLALGKPVRGKRMERVRLAFGYPGKQSHRIADLGVRRLRRMLALRTEL